MPLYTMPRQPSKGEHIGKIIAQALMGYMQGREKKRQTGLEERQMGLEEAVGQARIGDLQQPKAREEITKMQLDFLKALPTEKRAEVIEAMVTKPIASIMMGQPAAAAERTAIAKTRASIDALDNLKTLFDSAQTETGPIVGRIAPTKGLFGLTTKEQESFMAATSAFKNAIIKEITGAQMSEVEAKRIMKQVPDITDPPARWQAKWEQSKKNLEFLQKRRLEILRQSGVRVPGGTPTTVPPERTRMPQVGQTPSVMPQITDKPKPPPKDLEITVGKEKADLEMQAWMMIYNAWDTFPRQLQNAIKQRLEKGNPYMEIVGFDEVSKALDRYGGK